MQFFLWDHSTSDLLRLLLLQIIWLIRKPVNLLFSNPPSFPFIFLPQTETRMAAMTLITKTQIKFLSLDFFFVHESGRGQQRVYCSFGHKQYFHLLLKSGKHWLTLVIWNKHLHAGRSSLTTLITKSFKWLLCSKKGDDLSLNLMSQKSHTESVSQGSSALFCHFKQKIIGKETKRERWKTSFPSKGSLGNLEIHQNLLTMLVKESRS